jgi:hypothetical protein
LLQNKYLQKGQNKETKNKTQHDTTGLLQRAIRSESSHSAVPVAMVGESDGISVELVSLQGKRRKFDAAWQDTCAFFLFNDLWK